MKRPFLVTFTQTVRVMARNEAEAELLAEQTFAFVGAETENVQVEELDDGGELGGWHLEA